MRACVLNGRVGLGRSGVGMDGWMEEGSIILSIETLYFVCYLTWGLKSIVILVYRSTAIQFIPRNWFYWNF